MSADDTAHQEHRSKNERPQDSEPIVVFDNDADVAALPAVVDQPALTAAQQQYLRSQGISAPATWSAFRLGQVDAATEVRLRPGQRRLTSNGISVPTFDPRQPSDAVGLIRLTPAQNLHAFVTAPAGLMAPKDIDQRLRVVLCDIPLLSMRLYEAGVVDAAHVEDPAVIAPLADWFATREVVIVSTKKPGLAALQAALDAIGIRVARAILISAVIEQISDDVRALLGIAPATPVPPLPITPRLLHELVTYAQARLDAGEAAELLTAFGAAVPDLVRAYRIGYLPPTYRTALSAAARCMMQGHSCGRSLLLPALDADGQVVDACVVKGDAAAPHVDGLWPEPRGMLAPEIIAGQTTITVTDCLSWLIRLWNHGHRDALFLRGLKDAQANAARIAAAGVQQVTVRCYRNAAAIAAALQAAGLQVTVNTTPVSAEAEVVQVAAAAEPPAVEPVPVVHAVAAPAPSTDALTFIEEERDGQVAIIQAGPIRYAVTMRDDGLTTRKLIIRAHGKSCQHDLDLAVPAQRERTARNAAQQVNLPAAVIVAHLVGLLTLVQEREAARQQTPTAAVSAADRAVADAFLAAPDLLDQAARDLSALGWIGEANRKHLLYLTAISRMLPQPVWSVFTASAGSAPWQSVGAIASLTPPEDTVVFHRLTGAAMAQADRTAFRHKLLVLDQAEALRPEAALTLRVLKERSGAGWTAHTGSVAVLAAAAGALDTRCRDSFLAVTVDETPEQTASILAEQRQRLAAVNSPGATAAIQSRHHAAQRCLERLPVTIPFVDRIIFPATRVRHRDEQRWLLSLIAASALLHQRQRRREGGAVVASEADFTIAVTCTAGLIGGEGRSISPAAERLLRVLWSHRLKDFTLPDLAGLLPDWTRWTFRAALQDLADFGHLTTVTDRLRGGRAQRRLFTLNGSRQEQVQGIRLRPIGADPVGDDTGKLAETGGGDSASLSLVRTGT